jgi:hypothetical protein
MFGEIRYMRLPNIPKDQHEPFEILFRPMFGAFALASLGGFLAVALQGEPIAECSWLWWSATWFCLGGVLSVLRLWLSFLFETGKQYPHPLHWLGFVIWAPAFLTTVFGHICVACHLSATHGIIALVSCIFAIFWGCMCAVYILLSRVKEQEGPAPEAPSQPFCEGG